MNEIPLLLTDILHAHRGHENAITSRELAKKLQLTTREVRQIIADLVQAGHLIGASVEGADGGYFLIETEEELEATRAILRSRATHIFDRDRHLCASWKRTHGRAVQPLLPLIWPTSHSNPRVRMKKGDNGNGR